MRFEIRGYRGGNRGWFYIFDLETEHLIPVAENSRGHPTCYGTEAVCEKKLMQLLAEGGRPTKGAK